MSPAKATALRVPPTLVACCSCMPDALKVVHRGEMEEVLDLVSRQFRLIGLGYAQPRRGNVPRYRDHAGFIRAPVANTAPSISPATCSRMRK